MKRTKRYGGFLVGDRVKHKKHGLGRVEGYLNGCIYAWFDKFDDDSGYYGQSIAPNQLINLTRIEEKQREIPELPPLPQGLAEEMNKRCEEYLKIINQDDFIKGFKLPSFPKFHLKDIVGDDYEFEQEGDEQELTPDPPPYPYTRDVYTTTKDY